MPESDSSDPTPGKGGASQGGPELAGEPPPGAPPPLVAPLVAPAPVTHLGRTSELLAISLVNLLLKGVTLGIFHFWAKTRVRRYVWSRTRFAGEPFEYTGRGLELLIGYLIAMALVLPIVVGLNLLEMFAERVPLLAIGASLAAYVAFVYLAGFATYSARRYLLSRTRWRSIRFSLRGRARDHGARALLYHGLTLISGGLYLPFARSRLMARLIGHASFGNEPFRFDGDEHVLLRRYLRMSAMMVGVLVVWGGLFALGLPFLLRYLGGLRPDASSELLPALAPVAALALLVPSLALPWLWYKAGELRHFVGHTRLGGARFALELSNRRYVWLTLSNLSALVASLGLAYPWVVVRTARAVAAHLRMEGSLDLAAIQQSAVQAPRVGEGLADALDLGSI